MLEDGFCLSEPDRRKTTARGGKRFFGDSDGFVAGQSSNDGVEDFAEPRRFVGRSGSHLVRDRDVDARTDDGLCRA